MLTEGTVTWTIAEFRAWLESLEPLAIAGTTDNWEACPLATWRRTAYGETAYVCAETITIETNTEKRVWDAPDWVAEFVGDVDDLHYDEESGDWKQEPVSASECLGVLEEIVARETNQATLERILRGF